MAVTVRRAESSDLDALTALWKELAELHAGLAPEFALAGEAETYWRRHLSMLLADDAWCILLAEEDDTAIGFISGSVHENPPVLVQSRIGHISDAVVAASSRRRGVGEQLYQALVEWFRQREVTVMTLSAATANPAAQAFWRRMGFEDYMTRMRRQLK